MIICSKSSAALLRGKFQPDYYAIYKIESICERLALDPTVTGDSNASVQAFVVTDEDVKNKKLKVKFIEACAHKHEDCRVIFVSRRGTTDVQEGNGVDKVLLRPRPEEVYAAVTEIVTEIVAKAPVKSFADVTPPDIEKFTPVFEGSEIKQPEPEPVQEIQEQEVAPNPGTYGYAATPVAPVTPTEPVQPVELHISEPAPKPEPEMPVEMPERELSIVNQVRQSSSVHDTSMLAQQISAATLLKEMERESATYRSIEEKIAILSEKICQIMIDPSIRSIEEKLNKAHAFIMDKQYYKIRSNTIIEQHVETLIDTLTKKTVEQVTTRLKQLDEVIARLDLSKTDEFSYNRIVGITEERSNIILELEVLKTDIQNIFYKIDDIAAGVSGEIMKATENLTSNPVIESKLKLRGTVGVGTETLQLALRILKTSGPTSEAFADAERMIVMMQEKLNKLLNLDAELIAAQEQMIRYLKANQIEDTVIANTLIKKSMRVFIAEEGNGRTILPLTLSAIKSRANSNVLLVDLTGTAKYEDYGVTPYSIDSWLEYGYENDLCIVSGACIDSHEMGQRLLSHLIKAADHYRVINVVMDPNQKCLFEQLASDTLSVNYITSTAVRDIEKLKKLLPETKLDNVAQRVIINKCATMVRPIVEKLDLMDNLDVHVVSVPFIPQMQECAFNGVKPYEVNAITEALREVTKYA